MDNKEEIELKRLEMEYDIAKTSTTTGVNARLIFLGFLITINFAFYKGFYELFKDIDSNSTWLIILSSVVIFINMIIALLYIREHSAQDENHGQIWNIRERYNELSKREKKKHPDWFIFQRNKTTPFKGLTYKLVVSILSLLLSISILSLPSVFLKSVNLSMALLLLIFYYMFYRIGKLLPGYGAEMKNWNQIMFYSHF